MVQKQLEPIWHIFGERCLIDPLEIVFDNCLPSGGTLAVFYVWFFHACNHYD